MPKLAFQAPNGHFRILLIYGEVKSSRMAFSDELVIFWRDNDEEVFRQIADAVMRDASTRNDQSSSRWDAAEMVQEQKGDAVSAKKAAAKKRKNVHPESAPQSEKANSYWLLKMSPIWKEEKLTSGTPIFFRPKDYQGKLLETDPLNTPALSDRILIFLAGTREHPDTYMGYPGDYLWGEMEAEEQIEQTVSLGIRLKVLRTFYRPIPLHQFKEDVPELDRSATQPYEGFIPLSKETYNRILSLEEHPFQNNFLPSFLPEGNHAKTEDQLDFEADIDSFATVICLNSATTPMSIGLFGNWGSGKSFFMQKLEERIEKLRTSEYPEYVRHVVPVRFNSWHYSDANLWASMITHIFKSLNKYAKNTQAPAEAIKAIYAELNVTKEQLAQAQKALDEKDAEAQALATQKASVETELDEKRATLGLWKRGEIMRLVFADPFVQEDIRLLNEQFAGAELSASLTDIRKRTDELTGTASQLRAAWKDAKKYSRGGWLWVWLTVMGVGAACLVVYLLFREKVQSLINEITVPIAMFATLLTSVWSKLSPHLKHVRGFYQRLQELAKRVEAKKSRMELEKEAVVDHLQQSIAALNAEKTALSLQRDEIEGKRKSLENELEDIGSGKLLANFLAGKSTDDAYVRQLGIISWIREDFEQLNNYFERQKEVQQTDSNVKAALQIDRIVLYIDDLDRCNEDVVVRVLEAIHLLLAFPLFVVVVGVDPRWLNNALTEKYKLLFGEAGTHESEEKAAPVDTRSGAATSYDYLEKIFQIPFALKPITRTGREKLIRYLVRGELQQEESQEKAAGEITTIAAQKSDAPRSANAPTDVSATSASQSPTPMSQQVAQPKPVVEKKPKAKLVITAEELEYMQQIAPLFGNTPRTINRYVNIYRIIKAHGSLAVQGPYERDEFLPIMFLLAIIVGHASTADVFIQRLQAAKSTQTCGEFLKSCSLEKLCTDAYPLLGKLKEMRVIYLQQNLPLVARFSFRTLTKNLG